MPIRQVLRYVVLGVGAGLPSRLIGIGAASSSFTRLSSCLSARSTKRKGRRRSCSSCPSTFLPPGPIIREALSSLLTAMLICAGCFVGGLF